MSAPVVKNAPRYRADASKLTADPLGNLIEYRYVQKHLENKSETLLLAVKKVKELTSERNALTKTLESLRAIPEPTPPCACKPRNWRGCTCGAYRKGGFNTSQIDAYAEAMEVWEAFREILDKKKDAQR